MTASTSTLLSTLVYDNSMLADDAARGLDRQRRTTTFTRALQNMKTLIEGGTLPPRAPRAGGAGAAPAGTLPAAAATSASATGRRPASRGNRANRANRANPQ